jgi:predicted nuclease with RNAse H fold
LRTLGIDLAAGDERTALCLVTWSGGPPRLDRLVPAGVSDSLIVELGRDVDVVAIDAPFGWPIPFVDAVKSYGAGRPWPPERPDGLWFRRTDLIVQAAPGGRPPLSVSSDRIARPAERAARLLTLLGAPTGPVARDGADGVIEVYPAGALRQWRLDPHGYKDPKATDVRRRLRDVLLARTGLRTDQPQFEALAAADHPLDALLASLVGRAFGLGATALPKGDLLADAQREGWIHMPTIALEELSTP